MQSETLFMNIIYEHYLWRKVKFAIFLCIGRSLEQIWVCYEWHIIHLSNYWNWGTYQKEDKMKDLITSLFILNEMETSTWLLCPE